MRKRWQRVILFVLSFWLGVNLWSVFRAQDNECEITRRKLLVTPQNEVLTFKLINCLLVERRYLEAEKELARLRKISERQKEVLWRRRRSVVPWENQKEIRFWKERLIENPFYPDAWVSLALLWQQQEREEWAKRAFRKACLLDPVREDIRRVAAVAGHPCFTHP